MKNPEDEAKALRDQVNSKVRWGARDQEVLDWLVEKHGIAGDDADALLGGAHHARRAAVRTKAIIMLVTSALGIAVAGVFVGLQLMNGIFVIGRGTALLLGVGVFSIGVFLRNLRRLMTGKMLGSVD